MDKFIRDWMIRNWNSNWGDSRCFGDELERYKIEHFPGEFAKLYRIRFDSDGRMVENRNSAYARRHFPSLIRIWERERK